MQMDGRNVPQVGLDCFSQDAIKEYEEKYFSLLEKGRIENKTTSHKYAKQEDRVV